MERNNVKAMMTAISLFKYYTLSYSILCTLVISAVVTETKPTAMQSIIIKCIGKINNGMSLIKATAAFIYRNLVRSSEA